jgi:hypothetical protein
MARQDDLGIHCGGTGDGVVKVVNLEPKQDAVAVGLVIWITDLPVVVFDLKAMQLKDQRIIGN